MTLSLYPWPKKKSLLTRQPTRRQAGRPCASVKLAVETLEDRLTPSVSLNLVLPPSSSYGVDNSLVVQYTNTGTTSVPAPVVILSADNANVWLPTDPAVSGPSLQLLANSPTGPAGTLAPGAQGSIVVDFTATTSTPGAVNFSVGQLMPGQAIDWSALQSSLQPSTIPANAWAAVFANLTANLGSTTDSYQAALDGDATYLAQLGKPANDVNQLVNYEINKANDAFSTSTLGDNVDAVLPAPGGLSLSFERWFQPGVAGRYRTGTLGLGWTNNWDISASTDSAGNVTINEGGALRSFGLLTGGSYLGSWGDTGVLTAATGGGYQLTETDGSSTVFNANGTLNYLQDSNGSRITASYTKGLLTQLTASNGSSLTLSYTNGLLTKVTDSAGETRMYAYDATGQYLLSSTDEFGTTSYSYVTGQGTAAQNALASISYPNNSHDYFRYDAQGRLIDEHQDNNQQDVTYTYGAAGGVTTTDANGNQSTVLMDDNGHVCQTMDALGKVTRYSFDVNGDLTAVNGPQGANYVYGYDSNGNLTSVTDPMGLTTRFSYNANNDLTSCTDARGNTTSYTFDSSHDLQSVTYANSTKEQYTYNALGEATQYVNANGAAASATYNSQGQVTQEAFADGSFHSYTYDVHGNLLTATSASGTITFKYQNSANPDLLTEVDYPNGQFLKFTYNTIGQRTQSVDQTGFTVKYTYDALGRLQELTDGSGNLIVQYTYDAAGNLIQQDNGNGTRTVSTYDGNGDVLTITNYAANHTTVNSFNQYTYDARGNVVTATDQDGQWAYTYDADGQLVHAVFTPNSSNPDGLTSQDLQYAYDAAGNRISETVNGVTTTYVANNVNEYTSSASNGVTTSYQYDNAGNLISQTTGGSTTTYAYNALDQLTGVNGPGQTASYTYDPLGHRNSQTVNGVTTKFLIGPDGLASTYSGSSSLSAHYTYGIGLVSQVSAGGSAAYYDFNLTGSTVGMTNAAGNYVNKYSYLPFGQTTTMAATLANPFTFVGQFGVMQDGSSLFNMRARELSPVTGQFLSNDPTGLNGGDTNIRRYVANNPVTLIDPSGLQGQAFDNYDPAHPLPPSKPTPDLNVTNPENWDRYFGSRYTVNPKTGQMEYSKLRAHPGRDPNSYKTGWKNVPAGSGQRAGQSLPTPKLGNDGHWYWPSPDGYFHKPPYAGFQAQQPKLRPYPVSTDANGNPVGFKLPPGYPPPMQVPGSPGTYFIPDGHGSYLKDRFGNKQPFQPQPLPPQVSQLVTGVLLAHRGNAGNGTTDSSPPATAGAPPTTPVVANPVNFTLQPTGPGGALHYFGPVATGVAADAIALATSIIVQAFGNDDSNPEDDGDPSDDVVAQVSGVKIVQGLGDLFTVLADVLYPAGTRSSSYEVATSIKSSSGTGAVSWQLANAVYDPAQPQYTTTVEGQVLQASANQFADPPLAVIDTTDPFITSASQVHVTTEKPSNANTPIPLVTDVTVTPLPNGVTQVVVNGVVSAVQPGVGPVTAATLDVTLGTEPTLRTKVLVNETASVYNVNPVPVQASQGQPVQNVPVATVAGPVNGPYAATINWGDGDTSTGQLTPLGGGEFLVTGSKPQPYASAGSATISVTVTGPGNTPAPSAVTTATVSSFLLTFSNLSPAQWIVNHPGYAGTIAVSSGSGSYSNLVVTGLPAGLSASLSGSTITLSGTPTQVGTFGAIAVSLQDSAGKQASRTYSMTINSALSYLVDSQGQLFTVAMPSGQTHFVAKTGQTFFDIGLSPAGQLYGVASNNLYQIDTTTGASTLIGPMNDQATGSLISGSINAMEFRADGTLFVAAHNSLYQVNPQTAVARLALTFPNGEYSAGDLVFDSHNNMFLTTTIGSLVEANASLTSAYDVGATGATGIADFNGLACTNGTLYGFRSSENAIYQIDTSTGKAALLTIVSSSNDNRPDGVYGVATLPAAVTAPLAVGNLSVTQWVVNQSGYSGAIAVSGGTGSYSNLVVTGLPAGLGASLSGSTITISGTPTQSGTFANIAVSLQDSNGEPGRGTFSLTINPATNPQTPTFTWATVAGAVTYDLWIADLNTGQVLNLPGLPGTSQTLTSAQALTPGHGFRWWAGAVNAQGATNWGNSQTFTIAPLAAPALSGPSGTLTTQVPTFTWSNVSGADHYYLWVNDQTTGQSQVVNVPTVGGTSLALTAVQALTPGHSYVWWVGAVSTNGQATTWSTGQTFTVAALAAPTVSGPTGTITTALPTFSWSSVAGADHYDLWVDDQTTGQSQVVRLQNMTGTTFTLTAAQALSLGHSFVWWLGAVSTNGQAETWSAAQYVTVAPLGVPVANGPTGTITTPTLAFNWTAVANADHYDLWVNDLTTGQSQVIGNQGVTGTTLTVTAPLSHGHSYGWWVRAVSGGSASAWSTEATFTVAPLAVPVLISPGGTGSITTPTFNWSAVAGADHYEIWVDDLTIGQSQVVWNRDVTGTSLTTTANLNKGDSFEWWVRAFDVSGAASAWSDGLVFTLAGHG